MGSKCSTFYPRHGRDGTAECSRCGIAMTAHPPFTGRTVQEQALEIVRLLTHYGHDCTVQTMLPDLSRALAREA